MESRKETRNKKKEKSLKEELINVVGFKEERIKIKERGQKGAVIALLTTFGVIGWNLIIPVILMLIIGKLVVKKFSLDDMWILNFLFVGLGVGIYNCYKEIKKEYRKGLKITGKIEKTKKEN